PTVPPVKVSSFFHVALRSREGSMAIRDESTGSDELLNDARYHRVSLLADPSTHDLASPMKAIEATVRNARELRIEKVGERIEKVGILIRIDWQLDDAIKMMELDVFGACNRNRQDARYKEVFPHGVAYIVAMRGEEETRAVNVMLASLAKAFPEIAKKHKKTI